ncbi:MAG: hypothetical protein V2I82_12015 [Halieaceae bacterium]|jgi:hypothetical protein|nr:hypothetical protein [Halieaceae bacterium]
MTTLAFDTLRYARRLKEVGVPEPQAEVQAELMAEAFGFYADNLLTKDHFTEVLNARFAEQEARFEARFAQMDGHIERRFAEQEAKFETRFVKLERNQSLHSWMLGLIVVTLVVPQLLEWFT